MTSPVNVVGTPGASGPAAEAAVREELGAIDTSTLEQLLELRKEQKRVEAFQSRAEEMKGNVAEAVYRRVIDDYAKRRDALEGRATPLKSQVRAEYRKLRALADRLKATNEEARLAKEELEFRHTVGELDDEQLGDRLQAPEQILEQCRVQLALVEQQRARFLEAFAPGEDIDREPPAPARPVGTPPEAARSVPPPPAKPIPVAAVPPSPPPVPASSAASREATAEHTLIADTPAQPEGARADATVLVPPESPDATVLDARPEGAPSEDATVLVPPEATPAAAGTDRTADIADERTFLLPDAALIATSGQNPAREYRLSAMNYIGRSEGSQIRLTEGGVSRKHAMIVASPTGFTIKDLQSQNGTFVNGERVAERLLADGDRVAIGDVQLLFRSPWPKRPADQAAGASSRAR